MGGSTKAHLKAYLYSLFLSVLFIILAFPVTSATIKGSVYGPDFELINDIIVKINSRPAQQYLVKNASYEFNVPTGTYALTADNIGNMSEKYTFSEKVEILEDGKYIIDVILMPDIGSGIGDIIPYPEDIYLDDPIFEDTDEGNYVIWAIIIAGFFAIGVIVYFVIEKMKRKGKKKNDNESDNDESYDKIYELIKKNKRMTQKEITKEVYLSDAKVSLVLTDMESRGIIRKIKKGRTNVIIWGK